MKIDYEMPEGATTVGEKINEIKGKIPPELVELVMPLLNMTDHFYQKSMIQFYQIEKLKLMWNLRKMEDEIESEGGSFKITKEGDLLLDGFSEELKKKIRAVLKPAGA